MQLLAKVELCPIPIPSVVAQVAVLLLAVYCLMVLTRPSHVVVVAVVVAVELVAVAAVAVELPVAVEVASVE